MKHECRALIGRV